MILAMETRQSITRRRMCLHLNCQMHFERGKGWWVECRECGKIGPVRDTEDKAGKAFKRKLKG
jgi:hypothetical protein